MAGAPGQSGAAGMGMEQIATIAEELRPNQAHVSRIQRMWHEFSTKAVEEVATPLRTAVDEVDRGWNDRHYAPQFGNPMNKAFNEIQSAASSANEVYGPLATLFWSIQEQGNKIRELKKEWDWQTKIASAPPDSLVARDIPPGTPENSPERAVVDAKPEVQEQARAAMERLTQEARTQLGYLSTVHTQAATALESAGGRLRWTGPRAGDSSPLPDRSPSAPTSQNRQQSPSQQQDSGQQQEQQAGGGEQQQGGGEQQPGGGGAGGGGAGGGGAGGGGEQPPESGSTLPAPPSDTGLSGGLGTAPRVPDTSTLPGGIGEPAKYASPVGGGGGFTGGGAGGVGGGGAGEPRQAARDLAKPPAAQVGQAPTLSGTTATGGSGASAPGAGGMPMMPPMHPPHNAGGAADAPKAGTGQPIGEGRSRRGGATLGVPSGLRGRTAKGSAASRQQPVGRRVLRDGQQGVELLDSEMWQVDEPAAVGRTNEREEAVRERRRAR